MGGGAVGFLRMAEPFVGCRGRVRASSPAPYTIKLKSLVVFFFSVEAKERATTSKQAPYHSHLLAKQMLTHCAVSPFQPRTCGSQLRGKQMAYLLHRSSGSGKRSASNRQAPAPAQAVHVVCRTSCRCAPQRFLFLQTPSRRDDSRTFHVRQSCRFLETTSLQPPQAALRLFPPPAAHLLFLLTRQRKRRWGAETACTREGAMVSKG